MSYYFNLFYEWIVNLPYCELYLSNINCRQNTFAISSVCFPSALYPSNICYSGYFRKYSIRRSRIRSGIFRVRISMALHGLQGSWQFNKALFLQTSWHTEIDRGPRIIMATVERSGRIGRRTRSLKMKTNSSSSQIIEAERIIKRDGFSYFLIANE